VWNLLIGGVRYRDAGRWPIGEARAVRILHRFAASPVPAHATTTARTTISGINPRRHAPLRHLGGFRSFPVLARHAPGDPADGHAHVDVGRPNPAC
jgi:hypothetical protein